MINGPGRHYRDLFNARLKQRTFYCPLLLYLFHLKYQDVKVIYFVFPILPGYNNMYSGSMKPPELFY